MQDTDDIPSPNPAFDYSVLASALVELLQRPRSTAFVLGVHGPWGSGKTTLLNAIRASLPKNAIIIDFNAWKYQQREALSRALILRVIAALKQEHKVEKEALDELERSLYESFAVEERGPLRVNWGAAATEAVLLAVSAGSLGVGGPVVGGLAHMLKSFFMFDSGKEKGEDVSKRVQRVAGILQRETTERAVRHVVSIEQSQQLFSKVTAMLGEARRIHVLIDDLDRCLPDSALEVFEAAKLFMDAPECVYIVAVDRAMIRRGLEWRYPKRTDAIVPPVVDPDEYIEKTITLSFDLPILHANDATHLLDEAHLPVPLDERSKLAVINVLGTNPRRLKRFAATLSMWQRIAQQMKDGGRMFPFSPLSDVDRPLFLKIACIAYLNSTVIHEMYRDNDLAARLQRVWNGVSSKSPGDRQIAIADRTQFELPAIREAALDAALWRAFGLEPNLVDLDALPTALRWFRSFPEAAPNQ